MFWLIGNLSYFSEIIIIISFIIESRGKNHHTKPIKQNTNPVKVLTLFSVLSAYHHIPTHVLVIIIRIQQ